MHNNLSVVPRNVAVVARGETQILLGKFASSYKLKGFSVQVQPESLPDGDVSTQVVRIDGSDGYSMYMHVVNYSDKKIRLHIDEV